MAAVPAACAPRALSAGLGKRVAIAEELRFGGTCVIRGCVPKKLLVYASQFPEHFEDAAGYGWTVPEASFDWPTLIANKDDEIGRLEKVYQHGVEKAGGQTFHSRAVLVDSHTIRIESENRTVTADKILIATGGRPNPHAALPGHEHCIFSNEAFDLPVLPKAIVIAGGGYIAVEFANIFHGLGVDTTLIYRGREILQRFDHDLRKGLHEAMESKGIQILCHTIFERIDKRADGRLDALLSDGKVLTADQMMLAIGRIPNTEDLGLEAAGVEDRHAWRGRRRPLFAHQRRQHLVDRRRHQPRAADAGGDPRGDLLRRDGVQGQSDQPRPRDHPDRRLLAARDRHGRPVRGRCGEAVPTAGDLPRVVQADAQHALPGGRTA